MGARWPPWGDEGLGSSMFHVQAWTTQLEHLGVPMKIICPIWRPTWSAIVAFLVSRYVEDSRRVEGVGDRQLPRASRAANDEMPIRGLLLRACFFPTRLHRSLL